MVSVLVLLFLIFWTRAIFVIYKTQLSNNKSLLSPESSINTRPDNLLSEIIKAEQITGLFQQLWLRGDAWDNASRTNYSVFDVRNLMPNHSLNSRTTSDFDTLVQHSAHQSLEEVPSTRGKTNWRYLSIDFGSMNNTVSERHDLKRLFLQRWAFQGLMNPSHHFGLRLCSKFGIP